MACNRIQSLTLLIIVHLQSPMQLFIINAGLTSGTFAAVAHAKVTHHAQLQLI